MAVCSLNACLLFLDPSPPICPACLYGHYYNIVFWQASGHYCGSIEGLFRARKSLPIRNRDNCYGSRRSLLKIDPFWGYQEATDSILLHFPFPISCILNWFTQVNSSLTAPCAVWSHRNGKGSERRRGKKGNGTNREITLNEIGFSQFIVGGCHKEVEKKEVCVRLTAEKPQIKSN